MLRYVLLALMAEGRPAHGYALMKAFAARSGVRLSIGNVYRELQRLRTEGLVVAVTNPADADPRRSPYVITDAGRAVLNRWFLGPAESFVRESVDRLHCRLALLGHIGAEHSAEFLDDLHAELRLQGEGIERQRAAAALRERETGSMYPVLPVLLRRRARHLAVDIEVLEELRSVLPVPQARSAAKAGRGGATQAAARRAKQ